MKIMTIILVVIGLVGGCAVQNSHVRNDHEAKRAAAKAQMEEWDRVAATYPEKNDELSTLSKWAIMSGKEYVAESSYMTSYRIYKDVPDRQSFIAASYYQIFLIYIDKYAPNRSIDKANVYVKRLEKEFPKNDKTRKARQAYNQISSNRDRELLK